MVGDPVQQTVGVEVVEPAEDRVISGLERPDVEGQEPGQDEQDDPDAGAGERVARAEEHDPRVMNAP
jgi:hypothetical protein